MVPIDFASTAGNSTPTQRFWRGYLKRIYSMLYFHPGFGWQLPPNSDETYVEEPHSFYGSRFRAVRIQTYVLKNRYRVLSVSSIVNKVIGPELEPYAFSIGMM